MTASAPLNIEFFIKSYDRIECKSILSSFDRSLIKIDYGQCQGVSSQIHRIEKTELGINDCDQFQSNISIGKRLYGISDLNRGWRVWRLIAPVSLNKRIQQSYLIYILRNLSADIERETKGLLPDFAKFRVLSASHGLYNPFYINRYHMIISVISDKMPNIAFESMLINSILDQFKSGLNLKKPCVDLRTKILYPGAFGCLIKIDTDINLGFSHLFLLNSAIHYFVKSYFADKAYIKSSMIYDYVCIGRRIISKK